MKQYARLCLVCLESKRLDWREKPLMAVLCMRYLRGAVHLGAG